MARCTSGEVRIRASTRCLTSSALEVPVQDQAMIAVLVGSDVEGNGEVVVGLG